MDHHLLDDEELPRRERELTLSTGAILGIFVLLALLCGGFFGFGYNMGRKSAPTPLTMSEVSSGSEANLGTDAGSATAAAKPAAGSPATSPELSPTPTPAKPVHHTPAPAPIADADSEVPERPVSSHTSASSATPAPAPIVRQPAPVSPAALSPSVAPAGTGSFMVQVAAVSHQEDANLLLGALRARGYAVSAHTAAGDSFIHVQVGPFRDKKEADAMRQRLLADGYNAIVKQ